jgi:hypothetical protein
MTTSTKFFLKNLNFPDFKIKKENHQISTLGSRVESPIITHVLISEHFPHSISKLSDFCVIRCANERATNVLSTTSEGKEKHRKHRKRMSDSFVSIFLKNSSRPLSSSKPISSSFLVCFE